jgi:hypothetical protein
MNDYMELREHLAHASRAGMPANVPSYYRGKSNVSTSTVNDQARYKLYQEYKDKYDRGRMELSTLKHKVATAKEGYDSYLSLKQEYDALAKKVANWEKLYKNAAGSTSQKQVESEQRKNDAIKSVAGYTSRAFVSGNGNIVKGLARNVTTDFARSAGINSSVGFNPTSNTRGEQVSGFFYGRGNSTKKRKSSYGGKV